MRRYYKASIRNGVPDITDVNVEFATKNHVYILGLAYTKRTDNLYYTDSFSMAKHFLAAILHDKMTNSYDNGDATMVRHYYINLQTLELMEN